MKLNKKSPNNQKGTENQLTWKTWQTCISRGTYHTLTGNRGVTTFAFVALQKHSATKHCYKRDGDSNRAIVESEVLMVVTMNITAL
jgi:hypothetical protein